MNKTAKMITLYWSSFLKDPTKNTADNGTSDPMLAMLSAMGKTSKSEEEITAFENEFERKLIELTPSAIDIDYNANGILYDVAEKTLKNWSDMSTFPIKTNMRINWKAGEVEVSKGYGKSWISLT